jgi:hypothetical protein
MIPMRQRLLTSGRRPSGYWVPLLLLGLGGAIAAHPAQGHGPTEQSGSGQQQQHQHSQPHQKQHQHQNQHQHHHHEALEWPRDRDRPTLGLFAQPDPQGKGVNVQILVSGFRFAPERLANPSDDPGEGHAHLYLNGEKIARLYGPWHHLSNLPPGRHVLSVRLSTNRHQELHYQGQAIAAETTLTITNP